MMHQRIRHSAHSADIAILALFTFRLSGSLPDRLIVGFAVLPHAPTPVPALMAQGIGPSRLPLAGQPIAKTSTSLDSSTSLRSRAQA